MNKVKPSKILNTKLNSKSINSPVIIAFNLNWKHYQYFKLEQFQFKQALNNNKKNELRLRKVTNSEKNRKKKKGCKC